MAASSSEDIDWMGMGKTKTKSKKKGFLSRLFSTSPKKAARKAARKAEKARIKSQNDEKKLRNIQLRWEKHQKCKKKGMRLSLNERDCEPITPPGSPTAYGPKPTPTPVGRYGEGIVEYLKSLNLEKQALNTGPKTHPQSDDEWSDYDDDDDTDANRRATQIALGRGGGKRRRKRRRKTRKKKKRKSRRKSRKRKRKRKTKKRR